MAAAAAADWNELMTSQHNMWKFVTSLLTDIIFIHNPHPQYRQQTTAGIN